MTTELGNRQTQNEEAGQRVNRAFVGREVAPDLDQEHAPSKWTLRRTGRILEGSVWKERAKRVHAGALFLQVKVWACRRVCVGHPLRVPVDDTSPPGRWSPRSWLDPAPAQEPGIQHTKDELGRHPDKLS